MKLLVLISKEELEILITDSLNACLQNFQKPPEPKYLPEWLTRKQVAEYLSCSLATVDNYTREGTLKKHYINGLPRFKRDEVRKSVGSI